MKKRLHFLDALRGVTLISMIAYHGMWNLVYLFGVQAPWYRGTPGYLWQQSICWTFILLSGFCWSFSLRSCWLSGSFLDTHVVDCACWTFLSTQTTVLTLSRIDCCYVVFNCDSVELTSLSTLTAADTSVGASLSCNSTLVCVLTLNNN